MMDHTPIELMATIASHQLEDERIVGVGTGLPMIAGLLAQRTHAPNLIIFFEAGSMAPIVPTLPISVGDSRCSHRAVAATGLAGIMETGQRGMIDYAFLGGAEVDMYGNINSTVIGDHDHPKIRLPGSGGANDFGSFAWRTIIIARHEKDKLPERVNFITTPGYIDGPGAREKAGLPKGTGPYRVITNLALMGFDELTCRMKLISIHPGVTVQQVIENTGFELIVPDEVGTSPLPTAEELSRLREIDPDGIIIGK
ncbi:MAG: 3-oxoacid CoA-transferase [Candidatus Thermoplasmatota archaeon]|nr:3-oxoacid CoA-transferase [Candidatus Thermoplasmatota archaeon]